MLLGKSKAGGNISMLQWNFPEGCAILKHFLQGYGKKSWKFQGNYLTIRLRASDFDEVIVNGGEARINYHLMEIESE